jgi:hypothetical protein
MKTVIAKPDYLWERLYQKLKGLPGKTASGFKAWQLKRDQAALESGLARIIDTANSHKAKGKVDGSAVYVALRDKAAAKIGEFCIKHNLDRTAIEAQIPALADLHALCVVPKQTPVGVKLIACLSGAVIGLILLGMASGLVSAGHSWVMNLLTHAR